MSTIFVDNIKTVSGSNTFVSGSFTGNLSSAEFSSASNPLNPVTGQIYYNTTLKAFLVYNGSAWITLQTTTTGGIESFYSEGGTRYKVHTFYRNDTFIPDRAMNVDVFIVAGGGSGGTGWYGGGGGAGGVVYRPSLSITAQSYAIVIGQGGTASDTTQSVGGNGTNSTAFGLTAIGGGAGGSRGDRNGEDGGSGGGAAQPNDLGGHSIQTTDTSISADSRAYGLGTNARDNGGSAYGGGGGGAGGVPPWDVTDWGATGDHGAQGGIGVKEGNTYTINGVSTVLSFNGTGKYYAAGGGGGSNHRMIRDPHHIGGEGSSHSDGAILATNGKDGTGSGGGGGTGKESTTTGLVYGKFGRGADGGSGIVIVRYAV